MGFDTKEQYKLVEIPRDKSREVFRHRKKLQDSVRSNKKSSV